MIVPIERPAQGARRHVLLEEHVGNGAQEEAVLCADGANEGHEECAEAPARGSRRRAGEIDTETWGERRIALSG